MIVHDAATTFVALIDAALMWARIIGAAAGFVLAVAAWSLGPLVAPSVKAAARRAAGPSWARGDLRARIYARTRIRRSTGRTRPPWAHTQPLDYEEAA